MKSKTGRALLAAALAFFSFHALALSLETPLPDAAQEARARALFDEIRCVVCEGQAIADSPAEVAADMRKLVRERVAKGESNEQIKAYLVAHYGNVILMQPPLMPLTWPLWFGPLLALLLGVFLARRALRRS